MLSISTSAPGNTKYSSPSFTRRISNTFPSRTIMAAARFGISPPIIRDTRSVGNFDDFVARRATHADGTPRNGNAEMFRKCLEDGFVRLAALGRCGDPHGKMHAVRRFDGNLL